MQRLPITVIILTFNEQANLPAALNSVQGWAKEVFVVDSYSTDRTVDVALQREQDGVSVVQHRFEDYSKQWNWALAHLPITGQWTLKLDADERVTEAFKEEAGRLIDRASSDVHGVLFRRRLFFMGEPLRFGGVQSNYDLRMWRTGEAWFEDRAVNEHAFVRGRTGYLESMVEHRDYKSVTDWLEKHNRYASLEAASLLAGNTTGDVKLRLFGSPIERRMRLKKWFQRLPLRHVLYFLYRYVCRLGFLDGRAGFRFAFLHATYFYWIDLKIFDAHRTGRVPEVSFPPRGDPHPAVAGSELQKLVRQTPDRCAVA